MLIQVEISTGEIVLLSSAVTEAAMWRGAHHPDDLAEFDANIAKMRTVLKKLRKAYKDARLPKADVVKRL